MFRRIFQFGCLSVSMALVGCGPSDVGYVEGTVTMDGEPLPNASVEFFPQGEGGLSAGVTDENGHYELHYGRSKMGAEIGEHLVQIRTAGMGAMEGDYGSGQPEKVPVKYNDQSELKRTVEAGNNEINFDLDSEGKIVQPPNY